MIKRKQHLAVSLYAVTAKPPSLQESVNTALVNRCNSKKGNICNSALCLFKIIHTTYTTAYQGCHNRIQTFRSQ